MKKALLILLLILMIKPLFSFGKNKVQYHDFEWQSLETEHFLIYYYTGGEELAQFCAYNSENALELIKKDFLYEPDERISIVVYNSHNHFEETNTTSGLPEESVGGFTEFFKNRVVIPYQGNWEDFRHVIHHELTHALMNQMMFGSNLQSIVAGMSQTNMPLWLIEGLAEYQSRGGWDAESDIYIRDAIYNGYLPSVNYLHNYMAYKGGQNLLFYISQTYGSKKIGDILRKISVLRSTENAFKEAIGLEFKTLSTNWHRWLESRYWPTLVNKSIPEKIATRLTHHEEDQNFINNSPSISPDGKKIAFLSDRSDYFDIFLMRSFDGKMINKIVAGQTSGDFEEMHWLRPGISWSPDSREIVFAAKSGKNDGLFIYNAEKGSKKKEIELDFDGIFSPAWSPDSVHIAFVGIKNGQSDIYTYNLDNKVLQKVTDDIFSENEPRFSPDGKSIVYSSDRDLATNWTMGNLQYKNHRPHNIFICSTDSPGTNEQITNDNSENSSPFYINDHEIGYISTRTGLPNLYRCDLKNRSSQPLTNLVSGISQLSYSKNKLTFTSLFNGGYDIYLIEDLESLKPVTLDSAALWYPEGTFTKAAKLNPQEALFAPREDLARMTFDKELFTAKLPAADSLHRVDSLEFAQKGSRHKPFSLRFTPDIISVNAGYTSAFGLSGSTYLQFSDQLSNHQISSTINLSQDILNSNFDFFYHYLPNRLNLGVGFAHNSVWYFNDLNDNDEYDEGEGYNDRLLTGFLVADYPLSRYTRFDAYSSLRHIVHSILDLDNDPQYNSSNTLLTGGLGFSYDNTIWGIVGPENGTRLRFDLTYTPSSNSLFTNSGNTDYQFQTLTTDMRKYFRLYQDFQIAVRVTGGISTGETPQQFLLGGISNWLGAEVNDQNRPEQMPDKYYSYFLSPLRGYPIYSKKGDRFGLVNLEFRYPFVNQLSLGLPPITIGYIKGVVFADLGSAWNGDNFRGIKDGKLDDLLYTSGWGMRANLGYFILRYDIAWQWDFMSNASFPHHVFSLGANF